MGLVGVGCFGWDIGVDYLEDGGGDIMVKLSILDWVTFSVLFGIFIWLVLKTVGIINTPEWLLYLPLFGAIFAAGSFYYRVIGFGEKTVKMENGFEKFRDETIKEIHGVKLNCVKNHG